MDTGCPIRMWYLMSKFIYMLIYMKVFFCLGGGGPESVQIRKVVGKAMRHVDPHSHLISVTDTIDQCYLYR